MTVTDLEIHDTSTTFPEGATVRLRVTAARRGITSHPAAKDTQTETQEQVRTIDFIATAFEIDTGAAEGPFNPEEADCVYRCRRIDALRGEEVPQIGMMKVRRAQSSTRLAQGGGLGVSDRTDKPGRTSEPGQEVPLIFRLAATAN
jgi:hypothetical protein